jgi:hypothetical protein
MLGMASHDLHLHITAIHRKPLQRLIECLPIVFRGFESYKDARTPRDHRVLQD